jgi:hypothetical protein
MGFLCGAKFVIIACSGSLRTHKFRISYVWDVFIWDFYLEPFLLKSKNFLKNWKFTKHAFLFAGQKSMGTSVTLRRL